MSNNTIISAPEGAKSLSSIYDISLKDINGNPVSLSKYKGKKLLIVNTASECGYTPQYATLEKLHENFAEKVAVLAFPSNDFGAQEPGDEHEIAAFCEANYGVTFPLFRKVEIKGSLRHPLYQWLSDPKKNGWNAQEPTWNFYKYLIDENGELIACLSPAIDPLNPVITG